MMGISDDPLLVVALLFIDSVDDLLRWAALSRRHRAMAMGLLRSARVTSTNDGIMIGMEICSGSMSRYLSKPLAEMTKTYLLELMGKRVAFFVYSSDPSTYPPITMLPPPVDVTFVLADYSMHEREVIFRHSISSLVIISHNPRKRFTVIIDTPRIRSISILGKYVSLRTMGDGICFVDRMEIGKREGCRIDARGGFRNNDLSVSMDRAWIDISAVCCRFIYAGGAVRCDRSRIISTDRVISILSPKESRTYIW